MPADMLSRAEEGFWFGGLDLLQTGLILQAGVVQEMFRGWFLRASFRSPLIAESQGR